MPIFILSSVIGGAIGGAIAGLLTDLDSISDPIAAGAVIGSVAGSISSLGQNLFMRSQGMQSKWFLFNLLSWPIIWIMGISITWSNHSIPSIASGAALIIISSGASLSLFLHKFPEVEF
jgi:hypothetical protein